jgi:glyoxylase-like metal-dependent hydrolase (beta-lactamase superfamily II)
MTQIAPRLHRVGHEVVNSYVVEHEGDVVIVDAGAPTYWGLLLAEL